MTSKAFLAVFALLLAGAALAGCVDNEPEEARPAEDNDGIDVNIGGDGADGGNETEEDAQLSGNASGDVQADA